MAKRKPAAPKQISVLNRRARFDYELGEEVVAGLVLTGPEARAARDGHVQLKGSYVSTIGGELWLNNASFSLKLNEAGKAGSRTVDTRPRKLLAHKKQIETLSQSRQEGTTIVPLKMLTGGRHIKLVVARGKGKRRYDKRESLKQRDQEREARRAIKLS